MSELYKLVLLGVLSNGSTKVLRYLQLQVSFLIKGTGTISQHVLPDIKSYKIQSYAAIQT